MVAVTMGGRGGSVAVWMVGWFFTMIIYWHHVVRLPVTHPWLCSAVIACADIVSRITEAVAKSPKAMAKLQP